jgi:uncharacterized protein YukE
MTDTNTAQMLADLQATDDAVTAQGWVAPGLGVPGAPLGLLGSTLDPLSALTAAGLGWFTPLVSFLGDGLTQLQGGNAAAVTSGAQDFGNAGQDITGVASTYRDSTTAQTSNWSGEAASQYRDTGARHAEGIAALGQASTTTGSAIIGAGQVVAQAIAEITELIAEAVAQIVPIMTQAVARAGETFGQSVVEAIPPCVGIAAEYALRIASKLAALMASGDNLLKLVQGGTAVVDRVQQALSSISRQSIGVDAAAVPGAAADQLRSGGPATAVGAPAPGDPGTPAPASTSGVVFPGDPVAPQGTHSWTPPATSSSATQPDASRALGQLGGSGVATSAAPSGAVPVGAGPATGARAGAGRGAETILPDSGQPARAAGGSGLGGVPLGAVGGARTAGEADKEHQGKYRLAETHHEAHHEALQVAPPVITSDD